MVFAIRCFLSIAFLLAGVQKLRQRAGFVQVVRRYDLLPTALIKPFAAVLPWAEIALAVGLLLPLPSGLMAYLVLLLLTVFTLAAGINLLRANTEIGCGCFGPKPDDRLHWHLLFRNVLWAGLAVLLTLH